MKILFLECNMGAAGDMLMSALYELIDDKEDFLNTMNSLGLPDIAVTAETSVKCGISGTHISVTIHGEEESPGHHHKHETAHRSMDDITRIIHALPVSDFVKEHACAVYALIAEAESTVHNKPVSEVHFHEVGALDAIVDIVGVCVLLELLSPEKILVSPIHVGSGQVFSAHGTLPVPAPATAYILRGVPTYGTDISGELCTPTGAALLHHFAGEFGKMPMMKTEKVGYGMGKKNFSAANCVRSFYGDAYDKNVASETAVELRCNVDDMTPEAVGYANELLLGCGALDCSVQSIYMKKNRPGFVISVLCFPEDADKLTQLLFKHTTTIGVRRFSCERYVLNRRNKVRETSFGPVSIKYSEGFGSTKVKPEFDDISSIASQNDLSFKETYETVMGEIEKNI